MAKVAAFLQEKSLLVATPNLLPPEIELPLLEKRGRAERLEQSSFTSAIRPLQADDLPPIERQIYILENLAIAQAVAQASNPEQGRRMRTGIYQTGIYRTGIYMEIRGLHASRRSTELELGSKKGYQDQEPCQGDQQGCSSLPGAVEERIGIALQGTLYCHATSAKIIADLAP